MDVDSFKFMLIQIKNDYQQISSTVTNVLAIVGAWYTLKFSINLIREIFVWANAVKKKRKQRNLIKTYGQWAIVTGCTSGIGQAIARELASKGLSLVLVGRNHELLCKESSFIENAFGVRALIFEADLTKLCEAKIQALRDISCQMDVGMLVNNAGVHYEYPMLFHEVDAARVNAIVQVNMSAVVAVTHAVLPGMLARGRGLVVNMGSSAGLLPGPLIALYSASKAFIEHFSESLHHECGARNVHVQALTPMYVRTGMTSYSSLLLASRWLTPTADAYARRAVASFGLYASNTGYFPHTVQSWLIRHTPRFLAVRVGHHLQRFLARQGRESCKKTT